MSSSKISRRPTQRLQLACEPCKLSKLKCDRGLPICEACYRRSREAQCKYTERGLRYNTAAKKASAARERLDRFGAFVSRLQDTVRTQQSSDQPTSSSTPLSNLPHMSDSGQIGTLSLADLEVNQWSEPPSWDAIIQDIDEFKSFLDIDQFSDTPQSLTRTTSLETPASSTYTGTFPDSYGVDELSSQLPDRADMDKYIGAWFAAMHPARILFHAPTFQAQYHTFWDNHVAPDQAWLALLFALCALGASTIGEAEQVPRIDQWRQLCEQALRGLYSPRSHLIEALVLYTLILPAESDLQQWHSISFAFQLCLKTGLHCEPAPSSLSQFAREMWRRQWLVVKAMEISISTGVGMVSAFEPSICDTKDPESHTDNDISPTSTVPTRGRDEYTQVQGQVHFTRFSELLCAAVLQSQQVTGPDFTKLRVSYEQLLSIRATLPDNLRMIPLQQSILQPSIEVCDRVRIELTYLHTACVLLRPWVAQGPSPERDACLDAAEGVVDLSIAFLELAKPGGQLASRLPVLLPHVHEFKAAASLLCSQIQRQQAAESILTRSTQSLPVQAAILRACELWSGVEGLSTSTRLSLDGYVVFLQSFAEPSGSTSTLVSRQSLTVPPELTRT